MNDIDQQLHKYSAIARLFGLISNTSQEHFIKQIKLMLGERFTKSLFKMVLEMSNDQQRMLLQRLENLEFDNGRLDRRGHARKSCLISVTYTVGAREYQSFILDISTFGVFIETHKSFNVGHEINMTFTLPNYKIPFDLSGKIVWRGSQGVGVKFRHLTKHQIKTIQSFSEKMEEVYEIVS
jgi:Tfp pilus assembly protein PilZ